MTSTQCEKISSGVKSLHTLLVSTTSGTTPRERQCMGICLLYRSILSDLSYPRIWRHIVYQVEYGMEIPRHKSSLVLCCEAKTSSTLTIFLGHDVTRNQASCSRPEIEDWTRHSSSRMLSASAHTSKTRSSWLRKESMYERHIPSSPRKGIRLLSGIFANLSIYGGRSYLRNSAGTLDSARPRMHCPSQR